VSEQERETELVAGTIGGITQKKADTWTVAVNVEGLQNPKNLWTKDANLVESLREKFGQAGAFVCGASYWKHPEHGQVRSLWIDSVADGTENVAERVATPAAAPKAAAPQASTEGMSKEEWARKDSAIHKMACIKTAADALKHTIPPDPTPEDLHKFGERVFVLVYRWHSSVIAERDDPTGEGVPFD
jgi:hypothetical protein